MDKREFLKVTGSVALGSALVPAFIACEPSAKSKDKKDGPSPVGELSLPDLPYEFNALSPIIDEKTMRIHHGKHHAGYTKKANKAIADAGIADKTMNEILSSLDGQNDFLRNNLGGFYNHKLFWKIMGPKSEKTASKDLSGAIDTAFGSMDNFKDEFYKAAMSVFGSGWAWLNYSPTDKKLFISTTPNQDNPQMKGLVEQTGKPVMNLDVWEHAYYLNYQNRRADYVKGFLELVNWEAVSERYASLTA